MKKSYLSYVAALTTLVLLLTGCSAQSDPLTKIIDREQTAKDRLLSRIIDNTLLAPESVRYVGSDSHDYAYFVGTTKADEHSEDRCLLITTSLDEDAEFFSGCGISKHAPMHMTIGVKELFEAVFSQDASTIPDKGERVGDVVVIINDKR